MFTVTPATLAHAFRMAPNMRRSDVDEIWAAAYRLPLESLEHGIACSSEAWAALVGDEVACIFGVAPASILASEGCPWMLGTPLIERHALPFLRRCRPVVDHWAEVYGHLANHVDARNTKAIRWLRWLGFVIHEAEPLGPMALPFHRFERGGPCASL